MKEPLQKKALITGISGQDGFFLSQELSHLGYQILGLTRDASKAQSLNANNISIEKTDYSRSELSKIISSFQPNEIYHFAAQPYVGKSWNLIDETLNGTATLTAHLLEEIRKHPSTKFFNASSSEIYTDTSSIISEDTEKNPTNPYGCAKLFSYQMVKAYRQNYGLFAINGIFFNHESEMRSPDFFSQKLIQGALDLYEKKIDFLELGNLNVIRDWGSAKEYMKAPHKLMQLKSPEDVNICFGSGKAVLDLVHYVFALLKINTDKHVRVNQNLVRDHEKSVVIGSNQKLSTILQWKPTTTIDKVLKCMLQYEMRNRGIREVF